jgi:hypothetical protein
MIKEKKEQSKTNAELKKFAKTAVEVLSSKSSTKANQRDITKRLNQGSFTNCEDMIQFNELAKLLAQDSILKDWPNKEEAELLNKAYQEALVLRERAAVLVRDPAAAVEAKELLRQMIIAKVPNAESRSTFQRVKPCSKSSPRKPPRLPNPKAQATN